MAWLRAQLDKDAADVEFAIGVELENLAKDGCATTREDLLRQVSWANRGLREVEAKRRLLDYLIRLEDYSLENNRWAMPSVGDALALLALPYVDRPGYRDEWKP